MKNLILAISVSFIAFSCNQTEQKPEQPSETVQAAEAQETMHHFGAKITPENATSSTELVAMMEGVDSLEIKVEGKINECCQTKGCWMDVDLGNGETMIVKFKDYDFFVPKNSAGQMAVMEGTVRREVQTVDWLQHKAKDAGMTDEEIAAITEPETKLSFVANGVIIKGEMEVPAEVMEETELLTEE